MDTPKTPTTLDISTLRETFRERVAKRIASGSFTHNAEVFFRDGSVLLLEMPDIGKKVQRTIIRSRAGEDAILVFHASDGVLTPPMAVSTFGVPREAGSASVLQLNRSKTR